MRAKYGANFYYITEDSEVYSCIEENMEFENEMYKTGNYFLDYYEAFKNIKK